VDRKVYVSQTGIGLARFGWFDLVLGEKLCKDQLYKIGRLMWLASAGDGTMGTMGKSGLGELERGPIEMFTAREWIAL
jgi:hypothetical protein